MTSSSQPTTAIRSTAFQPGHYRCTEADKYINEGERVRFVRYDADNDTVEFVRLDRSYTTEGHDFRRQFVWLVDGETQYAQEIADTARKLGEAGQDLYTLQQQLEQVNLSYDRDSGQVGGLQALLSTESPDAVQPDAVQLDTAPGLTLAVRETSLQQARSSALRVQVQTARASEIAQAQRKHMERLAQEAILATNILLKPIQKKIRRMEEMVWTLELYSGKEEELTAIVTGQPAPESTPLTVRQGVLSMAEESAVMLDEGGMDARDVERFYEWLRRDPARINQFLPEEKGIVGLVPTFHDKEYDDTYLAAQVADANRYTYFLIRNGENIYSVTSEFKGGRTLVPTHHEFMELFEGIIEDPVTGKRRKGTFAPGSHEFLKAEAQADGRRRHYYRVALILQGIIDRTAMLQPLPENDQGERRINLTTPDDYLAGRVRVIEDVSMALSDQRETFEEWLARVNGSMETGRRVVGDFSSIGHTEFSNGRYGRDYRDNLNTRFYPPTAQRPEFGLPLGIEGKRDGYFVAYYSRDGEEVRKPGGYRNGRYSGDRYEAPDRRASVKILPTDKAVLLFDHSDVTVEMMTDYLQRRQERKNYLTMIPLLKAAIRGKQKERTTEAPFRRLLTELGQSLYGFGAEQADAEAGDAILTYKLKLKLHRPLPVDDRQAFQACAELMRVQQGERENRDARRESGEFADVERGLHARHPDAMLICHRSGNEYAVLVPEREHESVYARVVLYKRQKTGLRQSEERPWRTLDQSWRRFEALFQAPRFGQWQFYASVKTNPTGPEVEALKAEVMQFIQQVPEDSHYARVDLRTPIAVAYDMQGQQFEVYTAAASQDHGTRGQDAPGEVMVTPVRFYREDGTFNLKRHESDREKWWYSGNSRFQKGYPWQAGRTPSGRGWGNTRLHDCELLFVDQAEVERRDAAGKLQHAEDAARRKRNDQVSSLIHPLLAGWKLIQWEAKRQEFLTQYGLSSAHLWTDHRKTIDSDRFPHHEDLYQREGDPVYSALKVLLEHGADPAGLTLAEVAAQAGAISGKTYTVGPDVQTLKIGVRYDRGQQ